jgi:hypothetical protein
MNARASVRSSTHALRSCPPPRAASPLAAQAHGPTELRKPGQRPSGGNASGQHSRAGAGSAAGSAAASRRASPPLTPTRGGGGFEYAHEAPHFKLGARRDSTGSTGSDSRAHAGGALGGARALAAGAPGRPAGVVGQWRSGVPAQRQEPPPPARARASTHPPSPYDEPYGGSSGGGCHLPPAALQSGGHLPSPYGGYCGYAQPPLQPPAIPRSGSSSASEAEQLASALSKGGGTLQRQPSGQRAAVARLPSAHNGDGSDHGSLWRGAGAAIGFAHHAREHELEHGFGSSGEEDLGERRAWSPERAAEDGAPSPASSADSLVRQIGAGWQAEADARRGGLGHPPATIMLAAPPGRAAYEQAAAREAAAASSSPSPRFNYLQLGTHAGHQLQQQAQQQLAMPVGFGLLLEQRQQQQAHAAQLQQAQAQRAAQQQAQQQRAHLAQMQEVQQQVQQQAYVQQQAQQQRAHLAQMQEVQQQQAYVQQQAQARAARPAERPCSPIGSGRSPPLASPPPWAEPAVAEPDWRAPAAALATRHATRHAPRTPPDAQGGGSIAARLGLFELEGAAHDVPRARAELEPGTAAAALGGSSDARLNFETFGAGRSAPRGEELAAGRASEPRGGLSLEALSNQTLRMSLHGPPGGAARACAGPPSHGGGHAAAAAVSQSARASLVPSRRASPPPSPEALRARPLSQGWSHGARGSYGDPQQHGGGGGGGGADDGDGDDDGGAVSAYGPDDYDYDDDGRAARALAIKPPSLAAAHWHPQQAPPPHWQPPLRGRAADWESWQLP